MADAATVAARLRVEGFAPFHAQMAKATADVHGVGNAARDISGPLKAAGAAITGVGAAISASLGFMVKAAIDFESSFAGVRKTVEATEEQFAEMSGALRQLATEIPVNVNTLNRIAEAAGQLGIEREAIVDFTRSMAILGVTTNLSSEEAATSLARLANIMGTNQRDFDRLGSTIVALGNNMETTEAEIVQLGLRLAGAARVARISEPQVLALAGSLSSVGIQAEAGGTSISKMIIDMNTAVMSGNADLHEFARVARMTASDFQTAFETDAAGAIASFIEGLAEIDRSGGNVAEALERVNLTEARTVRALLSLSGAGDQLRHNLDLGTASWAENTAATEEARRRFETTASQIQLAKNRLNELAITLGETFLPIINSVLQVLGNLATTLSKVDPTILKIGVSIAAVGAAFALVAGPILLFLGFLPQMAAGLALVTGGLTATSVATAAAGTTAAVATPAFVGLNIAMGPIAGIVLAITAAVAGAIVVWKNWDSIVGFFKGSFSSTSDSLSKSSEQIRKDMKANDLAMAQFKDQIYGTNEAAGLFAQSQSTAPSIASVLNDTRTAAKGASDVFVDDLLPAIQLNHAAIIEANKDFKTFEDIQRGFLRLEPPRRTPEFISPFDPNFNMPLDLPPQKVAIPVELDSLEALRGARADMQEFLFSDPFIHNLREAAGELDANAVKAKELAAAFDRTRDALTPVTAAAAESKTALAQLRAGEISATEAVMLLTEENREYLAARKEATLETLKARRENKELEGAERALRLELQSLVMQLGTEAIPTIRQLSDGTIDLDTAVADLTSTLEAEQRRIDRVTDSWAGHGDFLGQMRGELHELGADYDDVLAAISDASGKTMEQVRADLIAQKVEYGDLQSTVQTLADALGISLVQAWEKVSGAIDGATSSAVDFASAIEKLKAAGGGSIQPDGSIVFADRNGGRVPKGERNDELGRQGKFNLIVGDKQNAITHLKNQVSRINSKLSRARDRGNTGAIEAYQEDLANNLASRQRLQAEIIALVNNRQSFLSGQATETSILAGMATGGRTRRAGQFLVGEQAPEVISLPRGAVVEPLSSARGGVARERPVQLTYQQNAPVYGFLDFERQVAEAWRKVKQADGFRDS